MTAYLDASVVIAALLDDVHTKAASELLRRQSLVVASAWTGCEVTASLNRFVRTGRITRAVADDAEARYGQWFAGGAVEFGAEDAFAARRLLQNAETSLRAADALHLAIAWRLSLPLATFDRGLADAGREIGLVVLGA